VVLRLTPISVPNVSKLYTLFTQFDECIDKD
jgi:hypothetical protein